MLLFWVFETADLPPWSTPHTTGGDEENDEEKKKKNRYAEYSADDVSTSKTIKYTYKDNNNIMY